ncbi:hypothetical protein HK100_009959 [Physocladia obscura]|uniref:Uncharacterized protein n=1 Tax=Physocladia obscura TaxID=109957 RepID=A0AAD5XHD9_9FUNG|nr:hypothetical protein HK100_009959 [Physocladia obscura]
MDQTDNNNLKTSPIPQEPDLSTQQSSPRSTLENVHLSESEGELPYPGQSRVSSSVSSSVTNFQMHQISATRNFNALLAQKMRKVGETLHDEIDQDTSMKTQIKTQLDQLGQKVVKKFLVLFGVKHSEKANAAAAIVPDDIEPCHDAFDGGSYVKFGTAASRGCKMNLGHRVSGFFIGDVTSASRYRKKNTEQRFSGFFSIKTLKIGRK